MEFKYDEESVKAIIKRAESAQLPKEVVLSEADILLTPVFMFVLISTT